MAAFRSHGFFLAQAKPRGPGKYTFSKLPMASTPQLHLCSPQLMNAPQALNGVLPRHLEDVETALMTYSHPLPGRGTSGRYLLEQKEEPQSREVLLA